MHFLADLIDPKTVTLFSQPHAWLKTHGVNVVIIIVGAWVLRRLGVVVLMGIFKRAVRSHPFASETDRRKRLDTLDNLVNALSKVIVWLLATIMIVDELGINTAPLVASAGVAGVALGIGAQSLIKDFTNGLFIIVENQYRVGDYVRFDKVEGIVQAITIRTTILRDFDGNIHHVPNSSIVVSTNLTFGVSGINLDITVAQDTDLDVLEKTINQVGEKLAEDEKWGPKIKRKPYFAQVVQFTERGLIIKIMGETTPGSQWKVKTELLKRLRTAFDHNDIVLPLAPLGARDKDKKKVVSKK
jgi:small conductance mechanosensitive channel